MLSYDVVFEEPEDPTSRSFFSEIIASISDVRFSHSGRYVLSRDYLTVKVGAVCIHLFCYHSYQYYALMGGHNMHQQWVWFVSFIGLGCQYGIATS